MVYVGTVIKLIDSIIKISGLPCIYSDYIHSNKNKIVCTIELKLYFSNSTNKDKIYL
jgi:hypothetical protein